MSLNGSEHIQFAIKVETIIRKALLQCQDVMSVEVFQQITDQLRKQANPQCLTKCLTLLLTQLIRMAQESTRNSSRICIDQYLNLELSTQKKEAQVRKFVKMNEEMNYYIDDLEDKLEESSKQLFETQERYHSLFKTFKETVEENNALKKKVEKEEQKSKSNKKKSYNYEGAEKKKERKTMIFKPSLAPNLLNQDKIGKRYNPKRKNSNLSYLSLSQINFKTDNRNKKSEKDLRLEREKYWDDKFQSDMKKNESNLSIFGKVYEPKKHLKARPKLSHKQRRHHSVCD